MKVALLYLAAIAAAELVTAALHPLGGVTFHILILVGLVLHSSLTSNHPRHKLYLVLALAPLIRLLSLSMPLTEFPQIYWYALTAVPLLIGALMVVARLGFSRRQVALTLNKVPLQMVITLTGIPFGLLEFYILKPDPMVDSLAWRGLVLPSLILLGGTGFVEEFIFRGLMQRAAGEILGRWGWVYIAGIFAVLHTGYLSVPDVVFVFAVGLFFAWTVNKTGSLLGATLSHGLTNISLYLILPFLL